jgi:rhodanese-related sulfurtransferase
MPGGATYGAAADFNKFEDDQIRWITVHELHDRQTAGEELVLYDVRDQHDYSAGTIPGAEHLPQGDMFLNLLSMKPRILEAATKAAHAELVLFANTGGVNGPAASRDLYVLNVLVLEEFGGVPLNRILRLKGGLNEWKAAGFACAPPPRPKVAGSIEVLLEDASLAHLAAQLEGQSLGSLQDALASGGRTTLLNALKDRGLKLPDRQKLANAVQRTVRLAGGDKPQE